MTAISIFLTSCGVKDVLKKVSEYDFGSDSSEYDPHSVNLETYDIEQDKTTELLEEVLNYFDQKDKNALISLFAPNIARDYDLDAQIDKVFEIYDSTSKSYEVYPGGEMAGSVNDGRYYYWSMYSRLKNLQTNNGKSFEIFIIRCVVDDEEPGNVGLKKIYLAKEDGTNIAGIGEFDEDETFFEYE